MSGPPLASYRARVARALMQGARAALSPNYRDWADAMEGELMAISDGWPALRWAFGCFVAGQVVGIRLQVRRPAAFLPLAMSFVALAMVLGHFAIYGIVPETDEGTPAHVFQLLMILQGPIIALFAVRWLRRAPLPTLQLLACHAAAAAAAIVAVLYLT
jgi:hypothetical protein